VRWWSFGPFWRYEKMQKGRSREFFQWNIDLLGVNSPEADAELVAIAANFLKAVGLSPAQAQILVNNRQAMDAQFESMGIAMENRGAVSGLVDRRDKMPPAEWEAYAAEIGLSSNQLGALKTLLQDMDGWRKSEELVRLFAALDTLGVKEYVRYAPNIMRGLLYYTGTVFEAFDTVGSVRRSILGGGRYNNLLADVGGEPLPAVGFAMGDAVISIVLEELGLIPALPTTPSCILVTVFSPELLPVSFSLAAELRQAGFNVTSYPEPVKLPRQFKYADKMGMRAVLVVGPDEASAGKVTLKNLKDGTQETLPRGQIAAAVRRILESR
jgi:histidyl-tRNA synthetase